jgi:hypothetical protein
MSRDDQICHSRRRVTRGERLKWLWHKGVTSHLESITTPTQVQESADNSPRSGDIG